MNENLTLVQEAILLINQKKVDNKRLSYIINELKKIKRLKSESIENISREKLKSILLNIYESMNEDEQNKFEFKNVSQEYFERTLNNIDKKNSLLFNTNKKE